MSKQKLVSKENSENGKIVSWALSLCSNFTYRKMTWVMLLCLATLAAAPEPPVTTGTPPSLSTSPSSSTNIPSQSSILDTAVAQPVLAYVAKGQRYEVFSAENVKDIKVVFLAKVLDKELKLTSCCVTWKKS